MLKVGASKVCMNPPQDLFPTPDHRHFEGMYDDMFCRAIAIEQGEKRLLFVTYETERVPYIPDLAAQIAKASGYPEESVILAATDNHTSISDHHVGNGTEQLSPELEKMRSRWMRIEAERGIEAAVRAAENVRPARYGYGEGESYINTNINLQTPYGFWVESPNPRGFSDKTLAAVKFVDERDGKLIAALVNYPTPAIMGFLARDFDHKRKCSGNFCGIACGFAEQYYGDDAVVMWTYGAGGNQGLIHHVGSLRYEYPDGYTTQVPYPDGIVFMQMESLGRIHGADIVECLNGITRFSKRMPIRIAAKSVMLPTRRRVETKNGNPPFRMGGTGLRPKEIAYGQVGPIPKPPLTEPDPEHPAELKMGVVLLGDIAIVTVNVEMYAEIGRAIKEASPYKKTFVLTAEKDFDKVICVVDKSSVDAEVFNAYSPIMVIPGSSDELIVNCALELLDRALGD